MTQEHDKREDIRHKTADAITKIHELMEVRRRMPSSSKDPHDEGDIAGVARNLGEAMAHHVTDADFDPLKMILAELEHYEDPKMSPKQQAEARVAIEAMAIAFGVQHQFQATTNARAYAKAHPDQPTPPTGTPNRR